MRPAPVEHLSPCRGVPAILCRNLDVDVNALDRCVSDAGRIPVRDLLALLHRWLTRAASLSSVKRPATRRSDTPRREQQSKKDAFPRAHARECKTALTKRLARPK